MDSYLLLGGFFRCEGICQRGDAVAERSFDGLAVFEAVLKRFMRIEYDIARCVIIGIVKAQRFGVWHILGLPCEIGKFKHALSREENRTLVAYVCAGAGGYIAGP